MCEREKERVRERETYKVPCVHKRIVLSALWPSAALLRVINWHMIRNDLTHMTVTCIYFHVETVHM